MNKKNIALIAVCLTLIFNAAAFAEDDLRVLPKEIDGIPTNDMLKNYLIEQTKIAYEQWQHNYELIKTPQQITAYQKRLRDYFIDAIGGFPQRTPLNPQLTDTIQREGYRVEKIIFESQPKHYVTAAAFIPESEKFKPPYPGVIVPCGHSRAAKGRDYYQTMGALLALNGMIGFVFDPIDQGERIQLIEHGPKYWGVTGHSMVGMGSILLGQNTARFEIWDGMRAIDYLQSRPDIIPDKIGCTGCSGGGTQTSYLMALDDRIKAAAPSCYITDYFKNIINSAAADAEQNIFGQVAAGMNESEYLMMRAPTPILICAATNDFFKIEGTWDMYRHAKRMYTRMGFAGRIDLLESEAKHGYEAPHRQGACRWMLRWLSENYQPIIEPDIKLLSDEDIQCTPQGKVMLLPGARSVYDLNRETEKQFAKNRKKHWSTNNKTKLLEEVRKIAGIRELTQMPQLKVTDAGMIERKNYKIKKMILNPEPDIYLPALLFEPQKANRTILYINQKGMAEDAAQDGPIEKLTNAGNIVLAVDIRGIGETFQKKGHRYWRKNFGNDGEEACNAYVLGRSIVGMKAEDILACANYLKQYSKQIDMIAIGNVGIPALHAAALEPDLFNSIKIKHSLISFSNIIELGLSKDQFANIIHGALKIYDFDNLAATLGKKLTIEEPVNALGEPLN